MTTVSRTSRLIRALVVSASLAAATLMTGCASMYVDTATKEVPVASMKKPAQLKPTQVAFEFKTRGAPNAAATKQLSDAVLKQVAESGLFAPAAFGAPRVLNSNATWVGFNCAGFFMLATGTSLVAVSTYMLAHPVIKVAAAKLADTTSARIRRVVRESVVIIIIPICKRVFWICAQEQQATKG